MRLDFLWFGLYHQPLSSTTGRGVGFVEHDSAVPPAPMHLIHPMVVQVAASAFGAVMRLAPKNVNITATSIRIFRNAITSFQMLNSSLEERSQQASCILRPDFERAIRS